MTKTRDLADLGGGFIQAGTGAVQRTVESKLQDMVSVKDFGAVGDGVTDDTAAIQAAITASANKELVFPAGTYYITDKLTFTNHVVTGTKGRSIIKPGTGFDASATYILSFETGFKQQLSGIKLDTTYFTSANKASYPNLARYINCASQFGIYDNVEISSDDTFDIIRAFSIQGGTGAIIRGCLIENVKGDAIHCSGFELLITENKIINVKKNSSFVNRAIIGGQATDLIITNNYIENTEFNIDSFNSVCGVDVGGSDRVVISGNIFKEVAVGTDFESSTATQPGLSTQIICSNNVFTAKTPGSGNGIWLNFAGSNATEVVAEGNTVDGFANGIFASVGTRVVLSNNNITNTTGAGIILDSTFDFVCSGNVINTTSGSGIKVYALSGSWNDNFAGGIVSGNLLSVSGITDAIDVDVYNPTTIGVLLPQEAVILSDNVVHDRGASGSRTSLIKTRGNVISTNNKQNHIGPFSGGTINIDYGNKYSYGFGTTETFTGFTGTSDGSFGQTVDVVFRIFPGGSLTIDFTGTDLLGNGGVDLTVTPIGVEKQVKLTAERIFTGSGTGKWLCNIANG